MNKITRQLSLILFSGILLYSCSRNNTVDTIPPQKPKIIETQAVADSIIVNWKEPHDNVGITGYQLLISPYNNIKNPGIPKDKSDVRNIAGLPNAVESGNTLEMIVEPVELHTYYSLYLRAIDAAGNKSKWTKVGDVLSGGLPLMHVPYEPFGTINEGQIKDNISVKAIDKYGNRIDTRKGPFGKTKDGWYGLRILDRPTGMELEILCEGYGSTKAKVKWGTERVDF